MEMGEIGGSVALDFAFKNPNRRACPRSMKRARRVEDPSPFDLVTEEILFLILDRLGPNPGDKKAFALACRGFCSAESRHRRALTPLRADFLPAALARYPSLVRLDFSLCPRVTDATLGAAAAALSATLRSVDLSRSRAFSHMGLESLVANCGTLVEIDLSNGTDLGDLAAAAIGKARNLERLWLARCKKVTDMGIGCIAVGCPKLRLLCLKWCLGVTDLGVGLVAVKCKEMRRLDLSYVPITKECLPALLNLKHLEELALVGCLGIDDEGLAAPKQGCKSLEVLDMSHCQHVTHVGLSSVTNGAANLRQLVLTYYSTVTESLAGSFKKLSTLESIKLDGCQVTTSGLKAIGNSYIPLAELSLSKCSGVTDEGLTSIVEKHKKLVKLDITCCRKITDVSLASITKGCTSLTSLRMESCSLVTNKGFVLIGEHCHLLEELDLTDNDLDNEGLKALSRCHKLSSLKLGICLHINDDGLVDVGKNCPKLKELDLYRSIGITDAGVKAITQGCPNLQIINLSYCTNISDKSLQSLSSCSQLNTLEIRGCYKVSSAGLLAVAMGCKQLNKLDIKKCYCITDAGMLPLARLSQNLRQVNLSYCSVTDVGLLALASISCLQSMTILHLRGLTPNGLVAALLACGCLTKLKLHASFRTLISPSLLKYIEARGCMFQWRDKPFQDDLNANERWMMQQSPVAHDNEPPLSS